MTSQELNTIMMRLGLRKVEITPSIYALAGEINRLDKELEQSKDLDYLAKVKGITTNQPEEPKPNSL